MSASDLEEGALSVGWEVLLLLLEDVEGFAALLSVESEELELELESRRFFFFLLFLLKQYKNVFRNIYNDKAKIETYLIWVFY